MQNVADVGKACPDSSFCNGAETCNEHAMCVAGTPVDCSKTPFGAVDAQCGRAICSDSEKKCKVCTALTAFQSSVGSSAAARAVCCVLRAVARVIHQACTCMCVATQ